MAEEPLVKFLAEPRNARYACEVWQAFPEVLERIRREFWSEIATRVRGRVGKYKAWKFDFWKEGAEAVRKTIVLLPKAMDWKAFYTSGMRLYFCLQQESEDSDPFYSLFGIAMNRKSLSKKWKLRLPAALELLTDLQQLGFKSRPDWEFFAYKELDDRRYGQARVVGQLVSPEYRNEFAGKFLEFVDEHVERVQQINRVLQKRG